MGQENIHKRKTGCESMGILSMYEGKLQRILLDILFDVEVQPSETDIVLIPPISELLRKVCCFKLVSMRVTIWAFDQWTNEVHK